MAPSTSNVTNEPPQSTAKATDSHELNYDDILEQIGQMGKFQLRTFLWLCLPAFFPGIVIMSHTFTGAIPDYRCNLKNCDDNLTISTNNSFASLLNKIHLFEKDNQEKFKCYLNNTIQGCNFTTSTNDIIVEKCDRWVYDTSEFHSTIVSDFDLICDDEWKRTVTNSLFMFGMLVGGVTIGMIGDIIGRRKTFTLNIFVLACITTASAFSPNWITFCVMRFLSGIGACGHFLVVFVWGVEAVGIKYRIFCGFIYQIVFALGSASLGLVAYFIRDWRLLQLVISIPMFGLTALFWILPESIRWLITKKHYYEVRKLVLRAADINGVFFPTRLFNSCENQRSSQSKHQIRNVSTIENGSSNEDVKLESPNISNYGGEDLVQIFRSKILIKRIIVMLMAWIAGVMGYYGITYSTTNLLGNFYVNYELSILVEIPAYLLGMIVVEKIGRRTMLCGGLVISGIGCLVSGLVPTEWTIIQTVFCLIGKLFIACVMATLFSYTSEIFPTSTRSAMIGLCSTSGRLAGILAPIISDWGRKTNLALPFIIFAIVNISVGILCLLLPETKNVSLPATIKDAIEIDENSLPGLRSCRKNKSDNPT